MASSRDLGRATYVVALGSNRRGPYGSPADTIRAAALALEGEGAEVERLSSIRSTPALGPAGRGFANAALILSTPMLPDELLARLKLLEHEFGRRAGRRWGPRTLDLDILLWSGGSYRGKGLHIPHPQMRQRRFVLEPLHELVPGWRDPLTGLTVRQLFFRLVRSQPCARPFV